MATQTVSKSESRPHGRDFADEFGSPARISDFQPVIHAKVDKLCRIFSEAAAVESGSEQSKIVRLDRAWMALTTDIVTEYAFGESFGHLTTPAFEEAAEMDEALRALYVLAHFALHFPRVFPLLELLPTWLVRWAKPEVMPSVIYRTMLLRKVEQTREALVQGRYAAPTATEKKTTPTIFHELLLNEDLPVAERTNRRLADEAQLIVSAGLITTSWAFSVASFYVHTDRHIRQTLRRELAGSGLREPYDWHQLQRLPYLHGVVYEAARLAHGTTTRHPRLAPDAQLEYGSWTIPRNTSVSMTTMDVMMNEELFPEPTKFKPERWIEGGRDLERYFLPFGKGPRACLGMP